MCQKVCQPLMHVPALFCPTLRAVPAQGRVAYLSGSCLIQRLNDYDDRERWFSYSAKQIVAMQQAGRRYRDWEFPSGYHVFAS